MPKRGHELRAWAMQWLVACAGLVGLGGLVPSCSWNVLSTHPGRIPRTRIARFDLRGSPCTVRSDGIWRKCEQTRSSSPRMVDLLQSRDRNSDVAINRDLFMLHAKDPGLILWEVYEYRSTDDGGSVRMASLELRAGSDGWLEIHTVEHAFPHKSARDFGPGPPIVHRYVYESGVYVLRDP